MALNFDKFSAEGKAFMKKLAKELGYPKDTEKAGRVLQSILHAFRNQLTVEESIQLIAQFPMFLKAVYVNNWHLSYSHPKINHVEEFLLEVCYIDRPTFQIDFPKDEDIETAISVVIMALRKYVSLGELEDIRAHLPKELKPLLNTSLMI